MNNDAITHEQVMALLSATGHEGTLGAVFIYTKGEGTTCAFFNNADAAQVFWHQIGREQITEEDKVEFAREYLRHHLPGLGL